MEYYCHYTTLGACLNILNSAKRLENEELSITFWGSSIFYMNDPQEFYYGFNALWPLLKNKSYEYEHEVRIIQPGKDISNIKIRCNANGKLIPYIETHIPLKYLMNIVIGPACDFNATKKAIQTRLYQLGINNINILKSKVPYRIY